VQPTYSTPIFAGDALLFLLFWAEGHQGHQQKRVIICFSLTSSTQKLKSTVVNSGGMPSYPFAYRLFPTLYLWNGMHTALMLLIILTNEARPPRITLLFGDSPTIDDGL
jgi:hypothetical protein